jgi:hypothetical protein
VGSNYKFLYKFKVKHLKETPNCSYLGGSENTIKKVSARRKKLKFQEEVKSTMAGLVVHEDEHS